MSFESSCTAWREAAEFDSTIDPPAAGSLLRTGWVRPRPSSRDALFAGMASGEPVLFSDFPLDARLREAGAVERVLIPAIRSGFPSTKRARVRSAAGRVSGQPVPAVIDRWLRGASRFGVTDLHYIGTRFDRLIDTAALNAFNLLPRGAQGYQSQDSLVISARGAVTDSHSDDHSGSNHCFIGRKLWLLWETREGQRCGLEDGSHDHVTEQAKFDTSTFLRLRSSRWLVISSGQTMFIPAHLSHKVVTLEPYIGLGSFHAAFPGLPDLFQRWHDVRPQWSTGHALAARCCVDFLVSRALTQLRTLSTGSPAEREAWGIPHLLSRLRMRRSIGQGGAVESPHVTKLRLAALALRS